MFLSILNLYIVYLILLYVVIIRVFYFKCWFMTIPRYLMSSIHLHLHVIFIHLHVWLLLLFKVVYFIERLIYRISILCDNDTFNFVYINCGQISVKATFQFIEISFILLQLNYHVFGMKVAHFVSI